MLGASAYFASVPSAWTSVLINTPLQRGGGWPGRGRNRFNGFDIVPETVETVPSFRRPPDTPLKQGVNETGTGASGNGVAYPHQAQSPGSARLTVGLKFHKAVHWSRHTPPAQAGARRVGKWIARVTTGYELRLTS